MSAFIPSDISTFAFAGTILYVSYLCQRSFTNPAPVIKSPTDQDTWVSPAAGSRLIYLNLANIGLIPLPGIWMALISLSQPSPPSSICPNLENLNPDLFTWSRYMKVCMTLIVILGNIRLWCYRTLGQSFTFQLNAPAKLITTGPYAYVQHPSYPTGLGCWFAMQCFLTRLDGVLGCWLPTGANQYANVAMMVNHAAWALIVYKTMGNRIRDEEKMLHREFGKEWEEWSQKTWRLIPLIY
ncbi:MAG: hypothetical protein MMC33_001698 [Icmadophila ericetorum]|nr:hypothetical protein [Icmadophila ericetorum]